MSGTFKTDIGPKDHARELPYARSTGVPQTDVWSAIEYVHAQLLALSSPDAQYYVAAAHSELSAEVVVPAFIQTLLDDTTQAAAQATLGLLIGTDVQAHSAILDATTASFLTADETKLDGIEALADVTDATNVTAAGALMDSEVASLAAIKDVLLTAGLTISANWEVADETKLAGIEALADVTDTANVTAAGALMDSEVDADLKTFSLPASTTISAFGATLVDDANAAAAQATLGLAIGVNVQAYDADLTTWAGITPSANAQSLVSAASYAAMRTLLDLEAGTDFYSISAANAAFQALDAGLTSIAGLTTAADRGIYTTALDTYAVFTFTAAGRALLDDADASAQRTTLGLGSLAVLSTINNSNWSGTDLAIANGGTGAGTAAAAFTALKQAATTSATGVAELATAAETTTGTDAARTITPDGLAGSDYGKRVVTLIVLDDSEDMAVKDGSGDVFYRVPSVLNGYNLVDVEASVQTAGTTGTCSIQIRNVTDSVDMLSTKITLDSAETDSSTAATAPVINGSNDDVATGDSLRIDVDTIHTTAAKGLLVELTFQKP